VPRTSALRLDAGPLNPASAARLERFTWIVLGLVFAALLVFALGPHRIGDYFTETDFYGAYADGARMIQHGRLDPSRYAVVGPVYEIALAVAGFVIHDLLTAAELLSVVSMTVGAWAWIRLLGKRGDARLALAGALLLAVNGTFLRYGFSATTDALAFALQSLALLALLTTTDLRGALLAGALAGLAFLTRYNAAVLLVAGGVAIGFGGTLHPRRRGAALAFLAGFALPVVPWTMFAFAHGVQFASQLHHNIAYDVFAKPKGIVWDEYQRTMQSQFHSLGDVIAKDPGAVLARELGNVGEHLKLDAQRLLGPWVAVAALLGLVLGALDGTVRRLWPLLLAGLLQFLALVPAFHSERYSLAILPAYLALAAMLFASPRLALVAGGRVWLKAALLAATLVVTLNASRVMLAFTIDQLPVQVLECARVLRALRQPGDRVIARKPHIAFHGGVEAVAFPFADSLPALAAEAKARKVRWLFYSWPEIQLRPALGYLLDTSLAVPGLTVRHATAGRPAVLYEIGPEFGTMTPALTSPETLGYHRARGWLLVDSTDVRAWRARGRVAYAWARYPESRMALAHVLARNPDDAETLILYGETCLRTGDYAAASDAYDHAETLLPGSMEARLGRGWARLLNRQPAQAAELWRPVISATRDPATLARMVELYQGLGDAQSAAEARATLARLSGRR
jgi:hypothetical protein